MQVGEAELRETLRAMLAAHGVDCVIDGEWIQVRGNDARMQGRIRTDPDAAIYTQLNVFFKPWPGTLICESFGGFANTHDERLQDALSSFAGNTLHVWLDAFLGKDCGEHTGRVEFTNNGIARVAVHGNMRAAALQTSVAFGSTKFWNCSQRSRSLAERTGFASFMGNLMARG